MDDGKALSFRPELQAGRDRERRRVEFHHRTPSDAAPQVNQWLTPARGLPVYAVMERHRQARDEFTGGVADTHCDETLPESGRPSARPLPLK